MIMLRMGTFTVHRGIWDMVLNLGPRVRGMNVHYGLQKSKLETWNLTVSFIAAW